MCPVPGCGSPYLSWHHFDPPWHAEQHHRPEGMIALCREHHDHADGGNFTNEQLHDLKRADRADDLLSATFPWMRDRFLTVVGGNFYLDTPVPVEFRGQSVVALDRDEGGTLQLQLSMLSQSREPRMLITENTWYALGKPTDLACPPNGKTLRAEYDNGDMLGVSFVPDLDGPALAQRYDAPSLAGLVPAGDKLAAVEIEMRVGGSDLNFGPRSTQIGGGVMSGCIAVGCRVGLGIG